jgi:hypothetical protein
MKIRSFAVIAAALMVLPMKISAQEITDPVTPVVPEVVTTPETTVQEQEEPQKKEKKVKEKKVKEPKVREVKEKKEPHYGFLNHLGVGVGGGVLDGVSGMVGLPIGSHLQIRGSYSIGVPDWVYPLQYQVPDLGTYKVSGKDVHFENIVCRAEIPNNVNAFLDLYLSKRSSFHFTVGIGNFLPNSTSEILSVTADVHQPLRDVFGADQKLSELFVELNDPDATDPAKKQIRLSTDDEGILRITAADKQTSYRPYFGIGWGRLASINSFITMTLDLGVQKVNGVEFYGYNYDGERQVFTSGLVEHKDKVENIPVIGTQEDLVDKAAAGELPYLKGYMPVVRLGLNIRLF